MGKRASGFVGILVERIFACRQHEWLKMIRQSPAYCKAVDSGRAWLRNTSGPQKGRSSVVSCVWFLLSLQAKENWLNKVGCVAFLSLSQGNVRRLRSWEAPSGWIIRILVAFWLLYHWPSRKKLCHFCMLKELLT